MKQKVRNERGITLVALIITIIVLIILAAVTINAAFKSDFIGTATNGTINYANAQSYEQKQTEELDIYLKDALLKIAQNNKSGTGDTSSPTEAPTSSPTPESVPVSTENDIGKYVSYVPKEGTYDKSILDTYSGATTNNAFITDTNLKWRIFKVEDDKLYLISDKPTTAEAGGYNNNGQLALYGANGYNNGVKLLNDICGTCYSNSNYSGMSARSVNIGDIEEVTTYNYRAYNNSYETYNSNKIFSNRSCGVPNIYNLYEISDQIGRESEQEDWYTGYTEEYLSSFMVKQNFWTTRYEQTNIGEGWKNAKYYELLIGSTDATIYYNYLLASRIINCSTNNCNFDLGIIHFGKICDETTTLFSLSSVCNWRVGAIRPMVIIPLSSCIITNSETLDTFDISPK